MPLAIEVIGTGENYTTIALWEAALDNAAQYTGQCKAESFAIATFSGVTYTASNFPHLTSVVGAEHDGRAHEVSGKGNARIESAGGFSFSLSITATYMRTSWLECKGSTTGGGIETSVQSGGIIRTDQTLRTVW